MIEPSPSKNTINKERSNPNSKDTINNYTTKDKDKESNIQV